MPQESLRLQYRLLQSSFRDVETSIRRQQEKQSLNEFLNTFCVHKCTVNKSGNDLKTTVQSQLEKVLVQSLFVCHILNESF